MSINQRNIDMWIGRLPLDFDETNDSRFGLIRSEAIMV
jgi:hypothetical protein